MNMEEVKVGDKVVGYIDLDSNVYVSSRSEEKHLFRKNPPGPGWGIDESIALGLSTRGIKEVRIVDRDSGKVYTVDTNELMEKGTPINLGHGKQIILKLDYWRCYG